MSGEKQCTGCLKDRPDDDYGVKRRRKDGSPVFQTRCRRCRSTAQYAAALRRFAKREGSCPVDSELPIRLPIGPLRAWLYERLASPEFDIALLSIRLDCDQRQVTRWLYEQVSVTLDAVDAALCRFGDPGLLRVLYPELYVFDGDDTGDEAAAA